VLRVLCSLRALVPVLAVALVRVLPAAAQSAAPQPAPAKPAATAKRSGAQPRENVAVSTVTRPFIGDLDAMIKRRLIRVLTTYSKTHYFIDKGAPRGIIYDAMRKFEDGLNAKLGTKHLKVNVAFVPVSRDELLPALVQGKGDVAMASLTITPGREQQVDFTRPTATDVSEIVVTGPGSPALTSVDDLAGRPSGPRRSRG
jgi:ABC-type amino acid transport substrate-binding protein